MKNKLNIILGCLWLAIALFFGWVLCNRLSNGRNHLLFSSRVADSIFGDDGIIIDVDDLSGADISNLYKQYTFRASDIKEMNISLVSSNVHFIPYDGYDLSVELYGNWNDQLEPSVSVERNKLVIKSPNVKIKNSVKIGPRKLVIQVPESSCSTLFNADISTVSGSIHSTDISFGELEAESTSGSVHVDGDIRVLTANTVSGSIHVNGAVENIKCDSVSGSIHVETDVPLTGKNSANTVSGSIHITVPEESGFEFEWDTVSGSVRNAFYNGKCGKSGSQIVGNGKARINAGTISGSIHLNMN